MGERWSMDFVHDQVTNGRAFRVLTVVDSANTHRHMAVDQLRPAARNPASSPGNVWAIDGINHRKPWRHSASTLLASTCG